MTILRATHSLSGRLILASLIVLPIFVAASGIALDRAFAQSQATAERERLRTQMYLLLGATEVLSGELWLPEQLPEPRFNQPESGLYARILDAQQVLWQSPSTLMAKLPAPKLQPSLVSDPAPGKSALKAGQELFQDVSLGQRPAMVFSFDVAWQVSNSAEQLYRFQIFHDQRSIIAERNSYRQQLWRWLGGLTLLLIALQWGIQRWGLQPFTRLAQELNRLHSGENLTLSESYPAEINPVVQNLNAVVSAERHQRDRYRNTLSDLAHSLKTPLALLRSHLDSGQLQQTEIDEQISRMDDIIRHQLQRAVKQSSAPTGQVCEVSAIVERMISALQKVYADKGIRFEVAIDPQCRFYGDEGDLMECLGNLLDNACKYGHSRVEVSAHTNQWLVIQIADDGPGIPQQQRAQVLKRGARADTAQSGQGIGLAVVVDILASYGGALTIDRSQWGGALVEVQLPNKAISH